MHIYIFYESFHNIIKNIIFNNYVYCIVILVIYFIIYFFYLVSVVQLLRIILDICVRYEFISTQP